MSPADDHPAQREVRVLLPFDGEPPAEAHPRIVELIRHVQGLVPAPGLLPGRQHFDPVRVPKLLPHLWLVDVVREDPRRYRVRLVGGGLVDAGSPIRTGEFFTGVLTEEERSRSHAFFDRILADKHIDWRRGPSVLRHQRYIYALERVVIPLASDGQSVDMLMCMTLFYWQDGRVY
jgi:hypothetical protein